MRMLLFIVVGNLGLASAGPCLAQFRPPDIQSAEQLAARVTAAVASQTVSPAAFRKPSDSDDTASIQAALDTGQSVVLEPGRIYVIARTLLMRPGQRLAGGSGTVLKAKAGWVRPTPPDRNGYTMVSNVGYLAEALTDRYLLVEDLTFDGTDISYAAGAFHGIGFRQARDVVVRRVHCISMGNCTAFESSDGTLVTDSMAEGISNVGFDHWEGPRNATVRNVTIRPLAKGTGVMFTASGGSWTQSRARRGANLVATGVVVEGPMLAGVVTNILAPNSNLDNVRISDIKIDLKGNPGSGIMITGNITNVVSSNIIIQNGRGGFPIGVRGDKWGSPNNIEFSSVIINDFDSGVKNAALIMLQGEGIVLNSVRIEGGVYPYAALVSSHSTRIVDTLRPGRYGALRFQAWSPTECKGARYDC